MGGFTLPELLLAMSFGSLIMLSAAKTYPVLRQQSAALSRLYRLEQSMQQALLSLQKDLRRSGFCSGECREKMLHLGAYSGEAQGSCVLLAYDLNRNGRIEPVNHSEPEWFGYRLREGQLESQRGVNTCSGRGWENILDTREIIITHFNVSRIPSFIRDNTATTMLSIQLKGHWSRWPEINRQIDIGLIAENSP